MSEIAQAALLLAASTVDVWGRWLALAIAGALVLGLYWAGSR